MYNYRILKLIRIAVLVSVVFEECSSVVLYAAPADSDYYPPCYYHGELIAFHGHPTRALILSLPDLSNAQRTKIAAIYKSTAPQDTVLKNKLSTLQKTTQLQKAGDLGSYSNSYTWNAFSAVPSLSGQQYQQERAQVLQQLEDLSRSSWLAAKKILTPQQLQELRQMSIDSIKNAPPEVQKAAKLLMQRQ